MDVLSDVLRALHPRGAVHHRSEMAAPWGLADGDGSAATYHVVLRGRCLIEVIETGEEAALEAGDVAVLPRGHAHALRDRRTSAVTPVMELVARHPPDVSGVLRVGDGEERTALVCGGVSFGEPHLHPLLEALPPLLVLRRALYACEPWLEHTLRFLTSEALSGRPGAEVVMSHLSCVLFIQAVRTYLDGDAPCRRGWLRALQDPPVSRALAAIHQDPAAPWTVERLASEAGLSRAGFAARFCDLVGEPPMRYVTRWRMYRAGHLLRTEPLTLADVAERVGYRSEAAFSRVFKRWMPSAPGAYRKGG